MKPVLKITALIAFLAFMFSAQTAQAEPENPIVRGNINVETIGGGKVTGTGIDCGTDCTDSASWRENEMPPKNRLTAVPNPGWGLQSWSGCVQVSTVPPRCDATYSELDTALVRAHFVDIQAPTVFIAGYNSRPGQFLYLNLNVADNHQVDRVEILLNGESIATRYSDFWTTQVDVSAVPEGVYSLSVRVHDVTGHTGMSSAWEIEIDHSGPDITLDSPVVATNLAQPKFSFSSKAEDYWNARCAIYKSGEAENLEVCGRGEWYSADAPTEGNWKFVVEATDEAGNTTRAEHEFVVDRTAPVAEFTSGPADGSVVEVGNVKYAWSVTDGLAITQECVWDNGESTPCDGSSARGLTAGVHSFKVTFTDQAGNQRVLARTVSVKEGGTKPPPDETDRTAPVVRLAAPKQKLKALGKALRLNVRCDEACSGKVTAKGKGGVIFRGRVALAQAGVAKLKLRPTARVRKRLKALGLRNRNLAKPRPLKLLATTGLKDKAGNTGKASLRFKVGA